ncbi:MAG: phosphatase PAP2 family protein [Promethearchaeota archaeon]
MKISDLIDKIVNWDNRLILKYNGFGGKVITNLLKGASFFGRETTWLILSFFFLFIWYDPIYFSYISGAFIIGVIFIAPTKKIINRERPFEKLKEVKLLENKPTSGSFPSWHVYNVTVQGLIFGFLLNSLMFMLLSLIFTFIVSFSRIQLGAHFPSDVIFGFLIGIIGFFSTIFFLAPMIKNILSFFELNFSSMIFYHKINPLLAQNIFYLFFCITLFCLILIIGFQKRIAMLLKKSRSRQT